MHTVFAFSSDKDRRLARNVALAQGLRNSQPGSTIRAPDGTTCACGERASLLHAPSTMKLWPGVQKLFQFYRPPFLPKLDAGAAFRSRSEQGEELGGGFWGSEGSTELAKMREGTLKWAVDTGGFLVAGNCASVPVTTLGNYGHVDFPRETVPVSSRQSLTLKAQTNARLNAHLFVGTIFVVPDHIQAIGLEFVIDLTEDGGLTRSVLRWGMQGEELAFYDGRILADGNQWSSFWVTWLRRQLADLKFFRLAFEQP